MRKKNPITTVATAKVSRRITPNDWLTASTPGASSAARDRVAASTPGTEAVMRRATSAASAPGVTLTATAEGTTAVASGFIESRTASNVS